MTHAESAFGRPRNPEALELQLHTPTRPHWSQGIEWRDGRWDPMSSAPCRGYPILQIRGRENDGRIFEPMHWASDLSGEEQPAFEGWFVPMGEKSWAQVHPVEWQPLRAQP